MKRITTALASMLLVCGVCIACTQADASQSIPKETTFKVSPNDITNQAALDRMQHERQKMQAAMRTEQLALVTEALEAEAEPEEEWVDEYYEWYEPDYVEYYEPVYYESSYAPTDGLTPTGGINYHDGRLETYYSSQILYHQDTADWTLDDEGFYRTDEGYYVVAASDMEQGTVFEGSKGECVVLDTGCPNGTTDYYVAW